MGGKYAYWTVVGQSHENGSPGRRNITWQDDIKMDQMKSVAMTRTGWVRLLINKASKLL